MTASLTHAHEAVIRDAIALHFVRSIPTAALHQTTWRRAPGSGPAAVARQPRDAPVDHVPASSAGGRDDPARLELALDEFYRPVDELVSSGAIFRVSLEDRFERVRVGFRAFDLKILSFSRIGSS